jgi:hypothetical protein
MNMPRTNFVTERLLDNLIASGVWGQEPTDADAYLKWKNTKCKQVSRILNGDSPMPANFILGWIAALPSEFKTKCMNDVCGAFGTFYTPLTQYSADLNIGEMKSQLADISKEFADVLQHAAPAMDGLYNKDDDKNQVQHLSNEIFELIATCYKELGAIHLATGVLPAAYVAMTNSQLFKK